jgi:hypothetical protein
MRSMNEAKECVRRLRLMLSNEGISDTDLLLLHPIYEKYLEERNHFDLTTKDFELVTTIFARYYE